MANVYDGETTHSLTYVEFYCGVGGWTMALEEAIKRLNGSGGGIYHLCRLAALDHSNLCLDVLEHNFARNNNTKKRKRSKTVSIECLSLKDVHAWNADVWMMSPPCQPHTRQHDNQEQDMTDPRSKSFLHLCQLLEDMECAPSILLLENVVGFEQSGSCRRWRQVLSKRGYVVAHFHLTPSQVGLPNDRPRYFCVAVQQKQHQQQADADADADTVLSVEANTDQAPTIHTSLFELGIVEEGAVKELPLISTFLDDEASEDCIIPERLLDSKTAWCFDIVTPKSARSACFTSSYGKFVRGTGSVFYSGPPDERLLLQRPEDRTFDEDWADGLELKEKLRYFSGTEMAKLMGFADAFSFPPECTMRQQWKLLGNSLNVRVAARLCELVLRVWLKKQVRLTR